MVKASPPTRIRSVRRAAALLEHVALTPAGSTATAASFERQAVEADQHAVHLRRLLERIGADAAPDPFAAAEQAQQTG